MIMSFHCCLFQSSFDASIKLKEQVERSEARLRLAAAGSWRRQMKAFQLLSVSSRPQLSSPASPFTTAVCLITSISFTALSIGLGPSLASDSGGNCLQRRLANWELRLRSGPHTHLPNLIDFLPSQFLQSLLKPSEAPPCLSFWGSTQILTHTHTLQNKVERLAETTPRSLHLSAPPPLSFPSLRLPSRASLQASLGSWVP